MNGSGLGPRLQEPAMDRIVPYLRRWETLLLIILLVVVAINAAAVPGYLGLTNQSNLLELSLEKAIVALAMAFVIISGEIDLSVASVMGLCAVVMAITWQNGLPIELAVILAVLVGALCGLFNGFWVAVVGLPSLAVTLAGLIGYRGLAFFFIEGDFIFDLPQRFKDFAQAEFIGPAPMSIFFYAILLVGAVIVLHTSGFGRYVYAIGNNKDAAFYSGVRVVRTKMAIFMMSGIAAAIAGVIIAARFGAVRGSTAEGFELEIITMVLLGGVSIFGGSGTMVGVFLATLLVLNLRNGMDLASINGIVQIGVVGLLLILSVLLPNIGSAIRSRLDAQRTRAAKAAAGSD
jgi:rhamnose transport system permease protein